MPVYSFPTTDDVSRSLAVYVSKLAAAAIAARGRFTVALSGGSLPKLLGAHLSGDQGVDWQRWFVFLADERVVPLDHADSNYRLCQEELFSKVSIPAAQIFPITYGPPPADVALDYAAKLRGVFGTESPWPDFDCILLGMGPDGHTCSLFPNHPLLDESAAWVSPILDSPKPPPERVTLTFPVLEAARALAVVSTGASKAAVTKQVLEDDVDWKAVPSKRVARRAVTTWFMDDPATADLKSTEIHRAL
eukprot:TRINITY_DN11685_c0_g1_i1.p1 TRINITY_DN11685_c0_g1~~TRINITY_DN11685_c0_g1_i1.p1  ORF type:complete len:248 (+),score=12.06 TRINITY_DN11685_c0_g1_i1:20-763(+)